METRCVVFGVVVVRYRLSWCLKTNRKLFVSFFFNVRPTLEPPRYYYTRLFRRQCWFAIKVYLLDVIISHKLRYRVICYAATRYRPLCLKLTRVLDKRVAVM